jgi:hypothetical protein
VEQGIRAVLLRLMENQSHRLGIPFERPMVVDHVQVKQELRVATNFEWFIKKRALAPFCWWRKAIGKPIHAKKTQTADL